MKFLLIILSICLISCATKKKEKNTTTAQVLIGNSGRSVGTTGEFKSNGKSPIFRTSKHIESSTPALSFTLPATARNIFEKKPKSKKHKSSKGNTYIDGFTGSTKAPTFDTVKLSISPKQ